jgi:hypothetical protein
MKMIKTNKQSNKQREGEIKTLVAKKSNFIDYHI